MLNNPNSEHHSTLKLSTKRENQLHNGVSNYSSSYRGPMKTSPASSGSEKRQIVRASAPKMGSPGDRAHETEVAKLPPNEYGGGNMNRHVWYLLIDESGQPAFDGVGNDRVKISAEGDVVDVYPTKDDITAKMPLESSDPVSNEHADKNAPLFVVVPKKVVNAPAERSVSFEATVLEKLEGLEKGQEKLVKGLEKLEKGQEMLMKGQEMLLADMKRMELSGASGGDGFKRTLLQYHDGKTSGCGRGLDFCGR
ncbi:hypothetical protein CcCBS67573_g05216 [Chytriomyces confervae]|uniref:Uncharacterized protein n=1 Tax=Chytriomyces confervae TaxID=246404 RepID=A0A507FBK6_9FUNG|nr:hypothetical protein CcCBS67573_g05216 [Chytriomyces confervae]